MKKKVIKKIRKMLRNDIKNLANVEFAQYLARRARTLKIMAALVILETAALIILWLKEF
jgi:hypothetical protein